MHDPHVNRWLDTLTLGELKHLMSLVKHRIEHIEMTDFSEKKSLDTEPEK